MEGIVAPRETAVRSREPGRGETWLGDDGDRQRRDDQIISGGTPSASMRNVRRKVAGRRGGGGVGAAGWYSGPNGALLLRLSLHPQDARREEAGPPQQSVAVSVGNADAAGGARPVGPLGFAGRPGIMVKPGQGRRSSDETNMRQRLREPTTSSAHGARCGSNCGGGGELKGEADLVERPFTPRPWIEETAPRGDLGAGKR